MVKIRPLVLVVQLAAAGTIGVVMLSMVLIVLSRCFPEAGWDGPHGIVAVIWNTALLFPILPACGYLYWAWDSFIIRDHTKRGICPSCGYDLRATPERCPECGERVIG